MKYTRVRRKDREGHPYCDSADAFGYFMTCRRVRSSILTPTRLRDFRPPPPPRQAVHPGSVQSGIVPLALVPPQRILAVIVTVVVVLPPECQSRIVELVQGGGRRRRRPRVGSRGRAVVALGFSCAYIASYVHPRLNDGEEKLGMRYQSKTMRAQKL